MSTAIAIGISLAFAAAAFLVLVTRVFHPRHRRVATGLWLVGWIPFAYSMVRHEDEIAASTEVVESAMAGYGPHIAAFFGLLVVGYLVRVLFPMEPTKVPELGADELETRVEPDLRQLTYMLDKVEAALEALLACGLRAIDGTRLTVDDGRALRERWARFAETMFELDVLEEQYRSFASVNPVTRADLHARCFLVAYAAYVAEYRAGMLLTREVGDNDTVRTIFDEAHPRFDLPADAYLALQRRSMHPDTLVRLNVGRAYLKLLEGRVRDQPAFARTRAYLADIERTVDEAPEVFVENPLHALERLAFDTWFPIQKLVAEGIGAVHAPTREYLIGPAELEAAKSRLEPADTLLERREWHLTNLGIPGYWTHAALYVGTLDTLDEVFDGLPELDGRRPSEVLRELRPEAHRQMSEPDEDGFPIAVIEAVGAGVVLTALEKSGHCDALGALRPRIDKRAKWQAVLDALEHLGKPYDYNFDFVSDNALVCSELVFKAYQRAEGISLVPEALNGRLLLSPNALCEKLDRELESDTQELDFVLFLDGIREATVEDRDVAAFRESHRRPKWHILVA
jgi:hypothetical protein